MLSRSNNVINIKFCIVKSINFKYINKFQQNKPNFTELGTAQPPHLLSIYLATIQMSMSKHNLFRV